jgi:PilZ domain
MRSGGRIEKRARVKVPVHIVPVENAFVVETTTTVNISRHGARLLTSRHWRPGEQLALSSSSGDIQRLCQVIYCSPLAEAQFCVGLEFDESDKSREGRQDSQIAS